jgi:hypothetical protein
MSNPLPAPGRIDRKKLLSRDYWLVNWIPAETTTTADIQRHLEDHLSWLLQLEQPGLLVMSGPLVLAHA